MLLVISRISSESYPREASTWERATPRVMKSVGRGEDPTTGSGIGSRTKRGAGGEATARGGGRLRRCADGAGARGDHPRQREREEREREGRDERGFPLAESRFRVERE